MEPKNVKKPHFWPPPKILALTRKNFEKFKILKAPKNALNAPKNGLGVTSEHFFAHFHCEFGSIKKSHFEIFFENTFLRPSHSGSEICDCAHATHL